MGRIDRFFTGRLQSVVDATRGSYWFLPTLMAIGSGAAAIGMVALDHHLGRSLEIPWITDTGADGTRAILSVISGSMITVTGVVFSITVVSLTLASSQFGPRLLRNFLRDRANQLAFGTFVERSSTPCSCCVRCRPTSCRILPPHWRCSPVRSTFSS
ncbi:MAG: DUF2254 family protein [Candidatus Eisenbacteria bacterium]